MVERKTQKGTRIEQKRKKETQKGVQKHENMSTFKHVLTPKRTEVSLVQLFFSAAHVTAIPTVPVVDVGTIFDAKQRLHGDGDLDIHGMQGIAVGVQVIDPRSEIGQSGTWCTFDLVVEMNPFHEGVLVEKSFRRCNERAWVTDCKIGHSADPHVDIDVLSLQRLNNALAMGTLEQRLIEGHGGGRFVDHPPTTRELDYVEQTAPRRSVLQLCLDGLVIVRFDRQPCTHRAFRGGIGTRQVVAAKHE